MGLNGYAGSGIVGVANSCNVTRTGAIGSIGDGCFDTAELVVNVLMAVAVAALVWYCVAVRKLGGRRAIAAAAAATLGLSSAYHILFGENDTRTAPTAAARWLDTRNATVPVTVAALGVAMWALVRPAQQFTLWASLAVAAGIAVVANASDALDDGAAAVVDVAGLVAAVAAAKLIAEAAPLKPAGPLL